MLRPLPTFWIAIHFVVHCSLARAIGTLLYSSSRKFRVACDRPQPRQTDILSLGPTRHKNLDLP